MTNDEKDTNNNPDTAEWESQDLASVKMKVFRGHKNKVSSVELCHDDRHLLSASFDHSCRIWDVNTGRVVTQFSGHHAYISEARLSQDERQFVASGWDRRMIIWDVETAKILWQGNHSGIVMSARFNSDASLIVSGNDIDHRINLWDTRTQTKVNIFKDLHSSTPTRCLFTPHDDRIITTSMDRSVKVFDLRSERITIALNDHKNVVSSAALSQNERKLATCSWDKTILIYDISTGHYRQTGPGRLTGGHDGCVSCVKFSEDGRYLISGGYDNTVVVWDLDNMVKEIKLQGHEDWIEDVTFSKDRKWTVSGSKDGTIRMWNIENAESLPAVVESKISAGVKVIKCSVCGKPFSYTNLDDNKLPRCVFCRMADPDTQRNIDLIAEKVSAITTDLEM